VKPSAGVELEQTSKGRDMVPSPHSMCRMLSECRSAPERICGMAQLKYQLINDLASARNRMAYASVLAHTRMCVCGDEKTKDGIECGGRFWSGGSARSGLRKARSGPTSGKSPG